MSRIKVILVTLLSVFLFIYNSLMAIPPPPPPPDDPPIGGGAPIGGGIGTLIILAVGYGVWQYIKMKRRKRHGE